jgi:hypothetical protein
MLHIEDIDIDLSDTKNILGAMKGGSLQIRGRLRRIDLSCDVSQQVQASRCFSTIRELSKASINLITPSAKDPYER